MNISKHEQRALHALAQGGRIDHHKHHLGDIIAVDCITRVGGSPTVRLRSSAN